MAWDGSLTVGGVQRLFNDEQIQGAVFQVLDMKLMSRETQTDRYRVILSDGQFFVQAMLATQCHRLVDSQQLQKNCIIRLKQFICNQMHGRRILILIDLEILSAPVDPIGQPQAVEQSGDSMPSNPIAQPPVPKPMMGVQSTVQQPMMGMVQQPVAQVPSYNPPPQQTYGQPAYGNTMAVPTAQKGEFPLGPPMPINMLSPFQQRFTLKARVTRKGDMRQYHNQKGQGQLFSVDLLDESGEIRATAFNDSAERLFKIFEEGKVYFISKGTIKVANKQYSPLPCDYEITFQNDTEVVALNEQDAGLLPKLKYNVTPISQIENMDKDLMVDVIGIAKETSPLGSVTMKSSGNQISKRDVTLVDTSQKSVKLTIWGKLAESFTGEGQPVLGCKGVRISDFNGKTLSAVSASAITVNPQIQEAFQLRGWYDSVGSTAQIASLSTAGTGGQHVRVTVDQIKGDNLGSDPNTSGWFTLKSAISWVKKESIYYEACPGTDCQKKVVDDGSGQYSCEKCGKRYPNCEYRYLLTIAALDHTGSIWLSTFNDQAEQIIGMSAADLHRLKESGSPDFDKVLDDVIFKEFVFRGRAKVETYQEEEKIKYRIAAATSIEKDYKTENQWLIDQIAKFPEE